MSRIIQRILRQHGADLLSALSDKLSPTDLQTLMLEVYKVRANQKGTAKVLEQFQESRFAKPSLLDPRIALEFDRVAFALAAPPFEPIELSPLAPLGSTATVTNISQNVIVSTARNLEVMADPTNVMALECALRRKESGNADRIRLCSSQRVTRAQVLYSANSWAHFRLFALTSAGRDEGSYKFEIEEMASHIGFYLRLLQTWSGKAYTIRIVLTNFGGEALEPAQRDIADRLGPGVRVELDVERESGRTYYAGFCFQIFLTDDEGNETFIADGGITDWTQKLLSNKKERLMVSGIGTERFCSLFPPTSQT